MVGGGLRGGEWVNKEEKQSKEDPRWASMFKGQKEEESFKGTQDLF